MKREEGIDGEKKDTKNVHVCVCVCVCVSQTLHYTSCSLLKQPECVCIFTICACVAGRSLKVLYDTIFNLQVFS